MMSAEKDHDAVPPLRNPQLTDALQTRDMAAIAFALRHGPMVVPLESGDAGEVWLYRESASEPGVLLLFSDAAFRPSTVPADAMLGSPSWLRDYLATHAADLTGVFLDFAGPHPLPAAVSNLIAALDA